MRDEPIQVRFLTGGDMRGSTRLRLNWAVAANPGTGDQVIYPSVQKSTL